MNSSNKKNVGIIGAGIAGLTTAKILLEHGFDVSVFEKEATLGGVWCESRTYPGLRANTAKETYSLTDYPYPASTSGYPEAEEVRQHLESYADHFGVRPCIKFNSEITSLSTNEKDGESKFSMTVCSSKDRNETEVYEFPFVVICSGAFSTPSIPSLPGSENFKGLIRHSSECTDPALSEAKRVVVIGAGKSALDCAAWAAREGKASNIVFRKPHWMVPRYFPGGARSDLRFISRFTELFVYYPTRPRGEKFLHGPGKPLVWLWWTLLSTIVPRVLGIPPLMVPDEKLPTGFESVGQVDDFFDLLNEDRISAKRTSINKINETSVELDDGSIIDADLIIFGTGWQRDLAFLSEDLRGQVFKSGRFHLYRRILPPQQQGLAFVGFFPTLTCPISSEVGAHWVAQSFSGKMCLPSVTEMDSEIELLENWAKQRVPESEDGVFTGPYIAHYVDELLGDMGIPTKRTSNFMSEYMGTFLPTRYGSLGQELREAHESNNRVRGGFYFSSIYTLLGIAVIAAMLFF
jgi:dimethylaniline monooxygenase (N-oxide forming)